MILEHKGRKWQLIDGILHHLQDVPQKVKGTKDDWEIVQKWYKSCGSTGIKPTLRIEVLNKINSRGLNNIYIENTIMNLSQGSIL